MEYVYKAAAAVFGAALSIVTGIPVIMWVLIGVMTLDYITGIICGVAGVSAKTEGGGLSSQAAFKGLLKKFVVIIVVLLAALLDLAIAYSADLVSFHAITGGVCLWFVASEGISILENAAKLGLPIPGVILQALEVMKGAGGTSTEKDEKQHTQM